MNISMKEIKKGRILIILSALFYGLAGVCVKSITWSPFSIVVFKSIVCFVIVGIIRKNFSMHFNKKSILGALSMSACGTLYVIAIKLTTAGTAIVLQYIAPILVFLYAVIFQKKKVQAYEAVLTMLVFFGCLLSFADSIDAGHMLGNVLAVLSGFAYAAQIIIMNKKEIDSFEIIMMANLFSIIMCMPFALQDKTISFDSVNLFWLSIEAVFQATLGAIFFSLGINKIDKVEASLLLTIEPIFNPIPVAIVCGEKMGIYAIIGAIIVIGSSTLYSVINEKKSNQIIEIST